MNTKVLLAAGVSLATTFSLVGCDRSSPSRRQSVKSPVGENATVELRDDRGALVTVQLSPDRSLDLVSRADALRAAIGASAPTAYLVVHIDASRVPSPPSIPNSPSDALTLRTSSGGKVVATPAAAYFNAHAGASERDLTPEVSAAGPFTVSIAPGQSGDLLYVVPPPGDPTGAMGGGRLLAQSERFVSVEWTDLKPPTS